MPRISLSGLPLAYSTTEKSNSRRQTKSMTSHSLRARSGSVVTGGPTKAILMEGFAFLMALARPWSPLQPTVEVKRTRKSKFLAISIVSSAETWCGGASRSFEPSSMPAGYASQTGYQYDSISRVAGQRELAPPSKFSKEGGLRNSVFSGMILLQFYHLVTGLRGFSGVSPVVVISGVPPPLPGDNSFILIC